MKKIDAILVEVAGDMNKPMYVKIDILQGKKYQTISFIPSEVGLLTDKLGYTYKGVNVPKK